MADTEIDEDEFKELTLAIGKPVRRYLAQPPASPRRPLTVLNALAEVAGFVLAATPPSHRAEVRAWFDLAVNESTDNAVEAVNESTDNAVERG